MIIFYSNEIYSSSGKLSGDESIHCTKVLRKKVDDLINVTDGSGNLYECKITAVNKKEVGFEIISNLESQRKGHRRAVAIAPTKNNDRFEWFLEKSTEIGITEIYPFISARSERKVIKPHRLEKILISAMKQSKNLHLPKLHELQPLKSFMATDHGFDNKFIAHCMNPDLSLNKVYVSGSDALVLIGPEGDFTSEEIDLAIKNDWKGVSLGPSRLRTETAGIVACHLLNL